MKETGYWNDTLADRFSARRMAAFRITDRFLSGFPDVLYQTLRGTMGVIELKKVKPRKDGRLNLSGELRDDQILTLWQIAASAVKGSMESTPLPVGRAYVLARTGEGFKAEDWLIRVPSDLDHAVNLNRHLIQRDNPGLIVRCGKDSWDRVFSALDPVDKTEDLDPWNGAGNEWGSRNGAMEDAGSLLRK